MELGDRGGRVGERRERWSWRKSVEREREKGENAEEAFLTDSTTGSDAFLIFEIESIDHLRFSFHLANM
jgi:hypothetical protein